MSVRMLAAYVSCLFSGSCTGHGLRCAFSVFACLSFGSLSAFGIGRPLFLLHPFFHFAKQTNTRSNGMTTAIWSKRGAPQGGFSGGFANFWLFISLLLDNLMAHLLAVRAANRQGRYL